MSSSESESPAGEKSKPQHKFRGGDFSVYEAVAGRVTTGHIRERKRLGKLDTITESQILQSAARRRIAPEDVLFRRAHAPTRYAEHDIYWANERDLPDGGRGPKPVLPESDLLKSIHGYTCRCYEGMDWRINGTKKRNNAADEASQPSVANTTLSGRLIDEKSMDDSAMLAFGILLEEAGRSALGKTGDLAFVEAEGENEEEDGAVKHDQVASREPSLVDAESVDHYHSPCESRAVEDSQVAPEEESRPKKKRRRNH